MGSKLEWKQYFPTCSFDESKNRDIALEEYRSCCKVLESEEKIFDSLLKYVISFGTIMVSLLFGSLEKIEKLYQTIQREYLFLCIALIIFALFWVIIDTFGSRQKTIVLAKRKIIILRRILGLHYGSQEFLFQKGGVEGSSSPFEIQLKFDYRLIFILFLFFIAWFGLGFYYFQKSTVLIFCVTIISVVFLMLSYLNSIKDMSENFSFIGFKGLFSLFGLKFVDNMEETLYRAKLSAIECRRLGVKINTLEYFAILIEDNRYKQHKGIDYIAMGRAILSRLKKIPPFSRLKYIKNLAISGGSTITQQLFRTLFIQQMDKKKIRRKVAEITLSRLWLNDILEKNFQLEIYLNSVRYSKNVHGVVKAMKHFFKEVKKNPTKAEAFFLVERVSVVSNAILPKTITLIIRLRKEKQLSDKDLEELVLIYEKCIRDKVIVQFYKEKDMLKELKKLIEDQNRQ